MAYSAADLLKLQSNIKRDPDGYRDEFLLQLRHYAACLQLFQLKPSKDSKEFGEFITFIAQVSKCYPTSTGAFAPELMALLEGQHALLDAQLRRTIVQALILMRNRNQLDPALLLPLLFKLFRVNDKALRQLLFRHIIADLKAANRSGRNERLNKSVQAFLYSVLADDNELAAKRSLAVLSELWRRNIWRDARTVNCIASAVFHRSPAVMAAALKFFLGQDAAAAVDDDEGGSDDEGADAGGGGKALAVAAPSKEEVYKAMHKGTKSSKRKKQAKLKRVMSTLKKAARREAAAGSEGFAALHLLHDPQGFAERLFGRLQGSRERWETRLDMMTVTSRVVGVHKLLLLNFYPFLQKYLAPHQRDVTAVLAALVQAAHELVPPEALAPALRQLVDQFVHDRARPEVMTVGLKGVRELCVRCPLVMSQELLQDLAEYRRARDKEVATAARALIGAFRELNPALLAKKDRGRGADLSARPASYGAAAVAQRLEGAELLQAELAAGSGSEGGGSEGWETGSEEQLSGEEEAGGDSSSEPGSEPGSKPGSEGLPGSSSSSDSELQEASDGEQPGSSSSSDDEGAGSSSEDEGEDAAAAAGSSGRAGGEPSSSGRGEQLQQQQRGARSGRKQQPATAGSLAALKRQLAAAQAAQAAQPAPGEAARGSDEPAAREGDGGGGGLPLEMTRILTEDDFRRIRQLKRAALVDAALARHGLSSAASAAKKARLTAAAEAEADEALALAGRRARLGEAAVDPADLTGRHKARKDKAERMASVLAGREGRQAFGARAKLKKTKQGGLSERQKQRAKAMPVAARIAQLRNRAHKARNKSNPRHFKGHVKGK